MSLTRHFAFHFEIVSHAEICGRNRDKLKGEVLLWTPTHGHTSVGRPVKTYFHHLCVDTECQQVDLPGVMDNRVGWRVKGIRPISKTWWWWYICIYIYIYIHICIYWVGFGKRHMLCTHTHTHTHTHTFIYIYIYN